MSAWLRRRRKENGNRESYRPPGPPYGDRSGTRGGSRRVAGFRRIAGRPVPAPALFVPDPHSPPDAPPPSTAVASSTRVRSASPSDPSQPVVGGRRSPRIERRLEPRLAPMRAERLGVVVSSLPGGGRWPDEALFGYESSRAGQLGQRDLPIVELVALSDPPELEILQRPEPAGELCADGVSGR